MAQTKAQGATNEASSYLDNYSNGWNSANPANVRPTGSNNGDRGEVIERRQNETTNRNSGSSQVAADNPLPNTSHNSDRGSNQMGGVNAKTETTNPGSAPFPDRIFRVRTGTSSPFRVGVALGTSDRDGQVDRAGEVITPSITPELPLLETTENAEDNSGGNFRFELEFLEQKSGVVVKIRERTRFTVDGKRPSFILGVFACGQINKRQLKALRAKTLPPGVKAALAEGDISYAVLEELFKRPGKGATAEARKAGQQFRQTQTKHNG